MQQYTDVVQDRAGNVQPRALVSVYLNGVLATIYSDNGITPADNPIKADNSGAFSFYAADGTYTVSTPYSQNRTVTLYDAKTALAAPGGAALVGFQAADGSSGTLQDRLRGLDAITGYSKRKYVVALTGQSNAAGANSGGPNPANSKVKVWDGVTGAWGSSDYTQNPFARGYPDGNNANNNIGLAFAHRLADQTGADVYLIYDAWGGRPIEDWMGAGTSSVRYVGIKNKIQAALASSQLAGITQIDYLIWAQGEENALTDDYNAYLGKFTTLDNQFRAETWMASTTPMLVMGMSGLHFRYQVWQAQLDYCQNVNRACVYVNSAGLKTTFDATGSGDFTHWLGNSLWEHGYHRIWYALQERGMTHRHIPAAFYSRGSGPWRGQTDAVALFDNVVGYSSRTGGIGVTDNFTGDGATTAYTLTVVGGTISSVTVGGVAKASPADYSVSGQTLTFAAAPANGAAIVLTYSQTVNGPAAVGSISWGYRCSADGNYTMAGGYLVTTDPLCNYSFSWGREVTFNANGDFSGAFGFQNNVNANYSLAAGRGHTVAVNGGVALGLFSKYTDGSRLFQYGIGTSSGARKNALGVNAAGNVEILAPSTGADPGQNEELTFRRISDSTIRLLMKGSDGTVRAVDFAGLSATPTTMGSAGSGTYTPTVSSASNCDSTPTIAGARYIQVGSIVHVSGTVTVDATATGDTLFKVSLPVASNLAATSDLSGTINSYSASAVSGGAVIGSAADDLAQFRINATTTSARDYAFSFSYVVQ